MKMKYNQAISISSTPESGVTQRSLISPILFNLYVSKPKCKDISISRYADDFVLYYTHEKQEKLTKRLQSGVKQLDKMV